MASSTTDTMRAVVITRPGDPSVLAIADVPRPKPREREVLVRVAAAALNRSDLLQRAGRYPAPPGAPSDIPGIEFAGTVAETGPGATRWQIGDRVFGIVGGGAQAEYLSTHEDAVVRVPATLSMVDAAAVPEVYITAHDALFTQAGLRPGERVLIFAIASGVGLAAVHLVRACGATAFGTTRTVEKLDRARAEGMTEGAAIAAPDEIPALVQQWTGGAGVDVVLDLVGGGYTEAAVPSLARRGRLMCIGLLAGSRATLDLRQMLNKRLTVRGTVLRGRSLPDKIAATEAFARDVLPLLTDATVRPVVDGVYSWESVADAHERLERGDAVGKLVLTIPPGKS